MVDSLKKATHGELYGSQNANVCDVCVVSNFPIKTERNVRDKERERERARESSFFSMQAVNTVCGERLAHAASALARGMFEHAGQRVACFRFGERFDWLR